MRFRLMLAWLVVAVVVTCALPLFAQYTDSAAVNELGGPQEFARRRSELAKQLKTGYLILFARKTLPEAVHYREDNDFLLHRVVGSGCGDGDGLRQGQRHDFRAQQAPRTKQVYGAFVVAWGTSASWD